MDLNVEKIESPEVSEVVEEKAAKRKYTKRSSVTDDLLEKKEEPPKAPSKAGRKKKSGGDIDKEALAKQICAMHMIFASFLKSPIWAISMEEANSLAIAVCGITEQYDFSLDPKVSATINLVAVAAMVYVPRAIQYKKELAKKEIPNEPTK